MRLYWLILLTPVAYGQTLRIFPVSGSPGEKVAIEISYDGPSQPAPAALRFDLTFPVQLIEPEGSAPEVGADAKKSGKSIVCASRKEYIRTCVMSGGQQPIPKGTVAVFRFKIRDGARISSSTIRISQATGATVDLKELTIPDTEAKLEVR